MNVGIITFQNAHNYGAQLQAYALKQFLESNGHDAEFINYINKEIEKNYLKWPRNNIKVRGLISAKNWIKNEIKIIYGLCDYRTKWNRFNDFISNYITDSNKVYSKDSINVDKYDCIICGSDQIWNSYLTDGFDDVYFANFNSRVLKISYAASSGRTNFSETEKMQFIDLINNFDYISVREASLASIIKNETKKDVHVVLDPTLLINSKEYDRFVEKVPYENYLLQYTLIDDTKLDEIVDTIAKRNNLKIIELRYSKSLNRKNRIQIASAGVKEFLSLINGASFVVTNSFHGTVFSILFKKKFYTINIKSVNSRIENLLNICELNDRCISDIKDIKLNYDINYENALNKLDIEKEKSQIFLLNALNERILK